MRIAQQSSMFLIHYEKILRYINMLKVFLLSPINSLNLIANNCATMVRTLISIIINIIVDFCMVISQHEMLKRWFFLAFARAFFIVMLNFHYTQKHKRRLMSFILQFMTANSTLWLARAEDRGYHFCKWPTEETPREARRNIWSPRNWCKNLARYCEMARWEQIFIVWGMFWGRDKKKLWKRDFVHGNSYPHSLMINSAQPVEWMCHKIRLQPTHSQVHLHFHCAFNLTKSPREKYDGTH